MKRILIYTALLLTIVAQSAWAVDNYTPTTDGEKTHGPWTFDAAKTGRYKQTTHSDLSFSFNGLNQGAWARHDGEDDDERIAYLWNDEDGIGFTMHCNSMTEDNQTTKYGIFSTYKHDEVVPAYTRKRLTWNYTLAGQTNKHSQCVVLYACDTLSTLKDATVDFTAYYSGKTDSPYYIAKKVTGNDPTSPTTKEERTETLTRTFDFDNSAESTEQTKSWNLLLTLVAAGGNGWYPCHQWGCFRSESETWETFYYKHITYYANEGVGEMDEETIENSGKLSANAFTREGFHFTGWATSADGTVVYADEETITATESDKGLVNLYAKWTSTPADAMALINKIPNPIFATEECHKPIVTARSVYNFLNGTEQAQVTNAATLLNAEAAYDVAVLIDAIGTVVNTAECKTKIDAARSNYNALTADQKAMVGNYSTLTTAEASYAVLDAKGKIAAIGEVTLESKAAIDAARAAFEVLTEAEEAQITAVELETLLAAEAAYAALAKSTIEFKGKDGASDVSSKQEAIYYPEIPDGYHWQTEQNDNISEDKTIVIKEVEN